MSRKGKGLWPVGTHKHTLSIDTVFTYANNETVFSYGLGRLNGSYILIVNERN